MEVSKKESNVIQYYQGTDSLPGIKFHKASEELGVSGWEANITMNIVEIDAGCMNYPEHSRMYNGLEEVFVVLKGDGYLESAGERYPLTIGTLLRVGPEARRKIIPGDTGITVLALSGSPAPVKKQ